MTDKAISPLRERMIEDMTAEKVQTDYIRYVRNFAALLSSAARPIPPPPRTFVCFNCI